MYNSENKFFNALFDKDSADAFVADFALVWCVYLLIGGYQNFVIYYVHRLHTNDIKDCTLHIVLIYIYSNAVNTLLQLLNLTSGKILSSNIDSGKLQSVLMCLRF